MESQLPISFKAFLDSAPPPLVKTLGALSAAVALTDDVASILINECAPTEFESDAVLKCLRFCDFIVTRNGEWQIERATRRFLLDQLNSDKELRGRTHGALRRLSMKADPSYADVKIPAYLTWAVGLAYHTAATNPEDGLSIYKRAYTGQKTGDQWLLGVLSYEQQENGILPASAIEPRFYVGMTADREGRWRDAEKYLLQVVESNVQSIEVAIALHVLGRTQHRYHRDDEKAKEYLERSLKLLRSLKNLVGQAQVLNSLGNILSRRNPRKAEEMLRQSFKLRKKMPFDDTYGKAQVLNSLANLIKHRSPRKAEKLLYRSLKLGEQIRNLPHQAEVLLTWGNIAKREPNPDRAINLLQESLKIEEQMGNLRGQAQVLHNLGLLVGLKRDFAQGERFLRRALRIEESIKNTHGQAMVFTALGDIYRNRKKWEKARSYYERALNLKQKPENRAFTYFGLFLIAKIHEQNDRSAREHIKKAIYWAGQAHRQSLVKAYKKHMHESSF